MKRNQVSNTTIEEVIMTGALFVLYAMVIIGVIVLLAIAAPAALAVIIGICAFIGICWFVLAYTRFGERLLKR